MANWEEIKKRAEEALSKETPSTLNAFLFKERYEYKIDTEKYNVAYDEDFKNYVITNKANGKSASFSESALNTLAKENKFVKIKELIELQLFSISEEPSIEINSKFLNSLQTDFSFYPSRFSEVA